MDKYTHTAKKIYKLVLKLVLILFILTACTKDHGNYITSVQPVHIDYNKFTMQWEAQNTVFYYEIYKQEDIYIAIYMDNAGRKEDNEISIEENPFYGINHPTSSYQYHVDSWYFNLP